MNHIKRETTVFVVSLLNVDVLQALHGAPLGRRAGQIDSISRTRIRMTHPYNLHLCYSNG